MYVCVPKTSLFVLSLPLSDRVRWYYLRPRPSCEHREGSKDAIGGPTRNLESSLEIMIIIISYRKLSGRLLETTRNKKSWAKNALKSEWYPHCTASVQNLSKLCFSVPRAPRSRSGNLRCQLCSSAILWFSESKSQPMHPTRWVKLLPFPWFSRYENPMCFLIFF